MRAKEKKRGENYLLSVPSSSEHRNLRQLGIQLRNVVDLQIIYNISSCCSRLRPNNFEEKNCYVIQRAVLEIRQLIIVRLQPLQVFSRCEVLVGYSVLTQCKQALVCGVLFISYNNEQLPFRSLHAPIRLQEILVYDQSKAPVRDLV